MKTKTVMISRKVTRHAARVVWDTIQASIYMRSKVPTALLAALNNEIKDLRATHKALKEASREGLLDRCN